MKKFITHDLPACAAVTAAMLVLLFALLNGGQA
jgi:hypothetical protein